MTTAERNARHARMIEHVRKHPDLPYSILCKPFGVRRDALAYVIRTKAPELFKEREGKHMGERPI